MRTSPRDVLRIGGGALGTWVKLSGPESVEIMAYAGFDFIVIDLEHAPLDLSTTYAAVALADALGLTPLVRVPDHSPSTVQKVLDMGAHGLVVPRVENVDEAQAVSRAFHFPPHGVRGAGSTSRAGRWGTLPASDYTAEGREQALLIIQIESATAVDAARGIVAVEGVHGVLVGSADLALDLETTPDDDAVKDATRAVRSIARDRELIFGLAYGAAPEAAARGFADGNDFALVANDTTLLATAAGGLVAAVRSATVSTSNDPA